MTDYKMIVQGNGIFLLSWFSCLVSSYIFPTFMDTMTTAFSQWNLPDSTFQGIGWIGLIAVWIIAMLVLPIGVIAMGLQAETPKDAGRLGTVLENSKGFLWSLASILIFYFGWYWTVSFSQAISSELSLLLILFWASVIAAMLINIIVVPAYIVMKNKGINTG